MTLELDKCCFFIDLRTGSLIIGYLNLIADIAAMLMTIFLLTAGGVMTAQQDEAMQFIGTVVMALSAIMLFFLILFLVFTIVLLVGVHQHKRGHVKAYLIYTLIFIVLYIILFFAGLAYIHMSAGMIVRDIITIVLSTYFLLVIRSYYLKMDGRANKPAIYNTA